MSLIVIGGVAAGLSAAARARRLDSSLEISVLEKSATISYGACGLPYYIEGQVRTLDELIVYTPAQFAAARNITIRTNAAVQSISHSRREVTLSSGERLHYGKLVIATGARPATQGISGAGQPHVFTLHTLDDAARLKAFIAHQHPKTATVLGAGYIGLEAAEALRAQGLKVRIVNAHTHVLGRQDAELTTTLVRHLERFGVELLCGRKVTAIDSQLGDVVILATGLRPNVEIAREAGVDIGQTGAIQVTDQMETNLTGVYAAGDCAEAIHLLTGRPGYFPLGTVANKMGRVAGANAVGVRERFEGVAGTSIVRVCGLAVAFTGLSPAQAKANGFDPVQVRIEHGERAAYFRGRPCTVWLYADRRSRRLLGATVLGEDGVAGRINVVATAIATRMTVDAFEQLDLAYAPPYALVWDPLLIAAQQLTKLLN